MQMFEIVSTTGSDRERPDFEQINVLEFERRVKLFAHPANNGKVSIGQLHAAFADTGIFESLGKPSSVTHKILSSPFFVNFALVAHSKNTNYQEEMHARYLTTDLDFVEDDSRYPARTRLHKPKGID